MGLSTDGMAITPYLNSWAYEQEAHNKKFGYMAFYKNKSVNVRADSSYEAQRLAAHYFRTKKSYEVTIVLVEKEGQSVIQSTN